MEEPFRSFESVLFAAIQAVQECPAVNRFPTHFTGEGGRIADAGVVIAASLRPGPVASGSVVKIFGVNRKGGAILGNAAKVNSPWQSGEEIYAQVPHNATGATNSIVSFGAEPAPVLFTSQAFGLSFVILQVAVRLPSNLPAGNLPLTFQAGNSLSQAGATLAGCGIALGCRKEDIVRVPLCGGKTGINYWVARSHRAPRRCHQRK